MELFDAALFNVAAPEASVMDPQQRLVLQAAADLAASSPTLTADAKQTGVWVGVASLDYMRMALDSSADEPSGFLTTAGMGSVVPGRVSYIFGFEVQC